MNTSTKSGSTCTHHNDQQRTACPVCLVSAITAERDQLRAEVERLETDYADYAFWKDAAKTRANHLESASQQMLAHEHTILQLRAELALLREWQREVIQGVIQNAIAHHAERKDAIARAERAEAELAKERARTKQIAKALTDAISTYFGADKLVTAERIEAWQAALKEDAK